MTTLIVIGGGYAGLLAANRAAAHGHSVTLVSERPDFVDRVRLHEVVGGLRSPDAARRPLAVAAPRARLVVARATAVREGAVETADGRTLTAGHVVLATGSGAGAGGWDWALRHRDAVAALPAGAVVRVRGAGLTGLEVATEVAEARPDLTVDLLDPLPIGHALTGPARDHLTAVLARLGVSTAGPEHSAAPDLDIDCTGFTLDPLARDSGLPVTGTGAVRVDEHLRVHGFERLWACGDAARPDANPHLRMACATAEPMAGHVIDQIGRLERRRALRPVSIGYAARCLSLGRREALVQFVGRDDTPTERVWRGRRAVRAKEVLCRFAVAAPIRFSRWYNGLEGPDA